MNETKKNEIRVDEAFDGEEKKAPDERRITVEELKSILGGIGDLGGGLATVRS